MKILKTRYNGKSRKSQVVIYDFLAAFVIFAVVILIVALLWYRTSGQIANDLVAENKMKVARDTINIMVKTEGNPKQWELNSFAECMQKNCSLGLAVDDNVLSQDKINAFINIANNISLGSDYGYNRTKELLNIAGYDFYFQVRDKHGNLLNSTGRTPQANLSINIKKAVIVDNNETIIEFSVY